MEIPLYTSGPECVESYKIRTNKDWALKTSGLPAGISRPYSCHQHSAARGAVAGVLLGASLWGVILALVGHIKL
jgi:hypothetical protein